MADVAAKLAELVAIAGAASLRLEERQRLGECRLTVIRAER
jgi:hypothetical protein